ncbi:hypothetical protein LEP1GSC171_2335 [Leptospira santarosai str. HAI1380]|uniref:Uncharacterized protein n=2 Tax=Leptospira santarosai TaxID=28183 RepID=M6UZV8_9LEPT|nr:hypothetical protein LEP1GSC179_0707 [Leptospira santarosai str. MOR084]EKR90188.1 hypothetical protein LEP1GSC163_1548 [Leptospira santarosai str. CBC379]EMO46509.1 hypothetical protein LEP1GSC187_2176 [Leptospira santarosai str. ZUN179]EMP02729.1 hypothetical protein LEP1GSC171_2335 [Leptospira santarosai str. HAI1380]
MISLSKNPNFRNYNDFISDLEYNSVYCFITFRLARGGLAKTRSKPVSTNHHSQTPETPLAD